MTQPKVEEQIPLYPTGAYRPPITPFLKWAGGKRQLIGEIRRRLPAAFAAYHEPFVGAGAVFMDLLHPVTFINDVNPELINCYRVIRDDCEALIAHLKIHRLDEAYYYGIRALDRTPAFEQLTDLERASRMIYLNRTCFNGLYRVTRDGRIEWKRVA